MTIETIITKVSDRMLEAHRGGELIAILEWVKVSEHHCYRVTRLPAAIVEYDPGAFSWQELARRQLPRPSFFDEASFGGHDAMARFLGIL